MINLGNFDYLLFYIHCIYSIQFSLYNRFFNSQFEMGATNGKIARMNEKLSTEVRKRQKLRNSKLFVLDNSLRESTVGQLRGHTLENKWKIYEEVSNSLIKGVVYVVGKVQMILLSFSRGKSIWLLGCPLDVQDNNSECCLT